MTTNKITCTIPLRDSVQQHQREIKNELKHNATTINVSLQELLDSYKIIKLLTYFPVKKLINALNAMTSTGEIVNTQNKYKMSKHVNEKIILVHTIQKDNNI